MSEPLGSFLLAVLGIVALSGTVATALTILALNNRSRTAKVLLVLQSLIPVWLISVFTLSYFVSWTTLIWLLYLPLGFLFGVTALVLLPACRTRLTAKTAVPAMAANIGFAWFLLKETFNLVG